MDRSPRRARLWTLGACVVATALLVAVSSGPSRGHRGPVTERFDGEVFHNLVDVSHGTPLEFVTMRLTTEYAVWPKWVETPRAIPERRLEPGRVRATFVNHATVLLQVGELNLLTDPIWSERASPVGWAGPQRVHAPGIAFDALPPIDAVLLSHDHYDHLDLPTLRRLTARDRPRVYAGLGLRTWLEEEGIERVTELDWWQSVELSPAHRVTFAPAQHWSGRGLHDRRRTLWGSFVVEHAGRRLYFAGDTASGPHFAAVARRHGAVDLAFLPIGAYAPPSFMASAHLDPAEAVAAHAQLRARTSMAIHFGCFQLSQEGRQEPAERLATARRAAALDAQRFVAPRPGDALELAPLGSALRRELAPRHGATTAAPGRR
jgi:L-ascorbate metabolism protein UlaG (beta-lactamase superfamily)